MMTGPWVFLIGSPLKLGLWVGNRLATWTGSLVVWRKLKMAPDRTKRFLVWMVALNVVSLLVLVGIWQVLAIR